LSQQLGVKVFTNTEVTRIHRDQKSIEMKDYLNQGKISSLPYDYLILSPGASPLRPKLPGIDHSRIMTLRNLQDKDQMDALISRREIKTVSGAHSF
jgi:NADPH-dependent 2,4-dienoyl-CoA reductase/sulfur reductase-like enzyme